MIININVFHDRSLSDNSKLVYAHIVARCLNGKEPFCMDSDAEIAKSLGKSKKSIQQSIAQLIDQKHIICELMIDVRLIWVEFP